MKPKAVLRQFRAVAQGPGTRHEHGSVTFQTLPIFLPRIPVPLVSPDEIVCCTMPISKQSNPGRKRDMKKGIVAGLLVVGLALPAVAATPYYVVVDTVKNCSVIEGNPSAGLTPIGDAYDSEDAAKKALAEVRKDEKQCVGVVE